VSDVVYISGTTVDAIALVRANEAIFIELSKTVIGENGLTGIIISNLKKEMTDWDNVKVIVDTDCWDKWNEPVHLYNLCKELADYIDIYTHVSVTVTIVGTEMMLLELRHCVSSIQLKRVTGGF
jgi:RNA-binding protein YhbY